jgi:hypothetical protein
VTVAAVELDVVGGEVVEIVRVIDGLNRVRFAGDPDLLAAWRSASNIIGPARSGGRADGRTGTPPPEGAVRPARDLWIGYVVGPNTEPPPGVHLGGGFACPLALLGADSERSKGSPVT